MLETVATINRLGFTTQQVKSVKLLFTPDVEEMQIDSSVMNSVKGIVEDSGDLTSAVILKTQETVKMPSSSGTTITTQEGANNSTTGVVKGVEIVLVLWKNAKVFVFNW